jgi:hypothetical protein
MYHNNLSLAGWRKARAGQGRGIAILKMNEIELEGTNE